MRARLSRNSECLSSRDGRSRTYFVSEEPAEFARLAINLLEANQLAEPRQELRSQGD